jgi:3'-phosphoadenosine 5'-phosphosulfate sulfotransferase (PAPS reductase)/FAD synthetase
MFSEEFPSARQRQGQNILACSGGNDSVALIRWAHENGLRNVTVLFNDTGWAINWWGQRIEKIKDLCFDYGFRFDTTKSEGFKAMVRRKKGFPMAASKMQFCSDVLKTQPTLKWLTKHDPFHFAVIYTGKRRSESQHRAEHPRSVISDTRYKGRPSEHPLVDYADLDRDLMIEKTGLDILLHSSMECFPCVNSNRSDFRLLARYPDRIQEIADLEKEMGFTSKGKPRVMFRPYRHMGAIGIKEVVKWGLCDRGKYKTVAA